MESVSRFLGTRVDMDLQTWESGSWREGLGLEKASSTFHLEQFFLPSTIRTHLSVHTSPPEGCWEKTALLGQNPPHSRLCTVSTPLITSSFSAQKFLKFDVAPLIVLLLTPEFLKRFYLCMQVLYLC